MIKAIKIVVGLAAVPLALLGGRAMFTPLAMLEQLSITPLGLHGLNTVRADFGGLLLGGALLIALGLWTRNTTFLLAVAVLMGTVAFGRVVGFALDGFDAALLPPTIVELAIAALMIFAHRKLRERTDLGDPAGKA